MISVHPDAEKVRAELEAVTAELLDATDASRTTIRIDLPSIGANVEEPIAEARGSEVPTLKGQPALNQRQLETVKWLDVHRKCLVQNACQGADPAPPQALIDVYGVKAQMLGPIEHRGDLIAWVSVHENRETREWSEQEIQALEKALVQVNGILDAHRL